MKVTKHITDLIDTLQERCPEAFPSRPLPKVPIAFHQHKAIQRILNVNYRTAEYILMLWCQGNRYDAAMVEGAARIRCDGVAKGTVSRREAEFHKGRLEEYYRNRAVGEAKYCQGSIIDYYAAKFPKEPVVNYGQSKSLLGKLIALFKGDSVFNSKRGEMPSN